MKRSREICFCTVHSNMPGLNEPEIYYPEDQEMNPASPKKSRSETYVNPDNVGTFVNGYFVPTDPRPDEHLFVGGYYSDIIRPIPGLYLPTIELDFASLYPSDMIASGFPTHGELEPLPEVESDSLDNSDCDELPPLVDDIDENFNDFNEDYIEICDDGPLITDFIDDFESPLKRKRYFEYYNESDYIDPSTVKSLTGGDPYYGRKLHKTDDINEFDDIDDIDWDSLYPSAALQSPMEITSIISTTPTSCTYLDNQGNVKTVSWRLDE